jgi:serine/threonine-protein kinase
MQELGVDVGDTGDIDFPPYDDGVQRVTVRESTPVRALSLRRLSSFELTGRLYLGPERVYGRFTQARWRDGTTYPVCLELGVHTGVYEFTPGVEREDVGGPADTAVVFSTQDVRAVERFE